MEICTTHINMFNSNIFFVFFFVSEIATENTYQVSGTSENNRYTSTLSLFEHQNMYNFLKSYNSVLLWSLLDSKILTKIDNYTNTTPPLLRLLSPNKLKRLILYLKKIKTKIKDSEFERLRSELRNIFQQIKSKYHSVGNHFKFLIFVLFLRLFIILKSCRNPLRLASLNPNFYSTSLSPKTCLYSKRENDIIQYAEHIINIYQRSFTPIFKNMCCSHAERQLRPISRNRRSLLDGKEVYNIHNYFVKSSIPVTIKEAHAQVDEENAYRVHLISDFLANSLPDLKIPLLPFDLSQTKTSKPYVNVDEFDSFSLPSPVSLLQHSTSIITSSLNDEWTIESTSQFNLVPLITHKPENHQPVQQITTESYIKWKPSPSNNFPSIESDFMPTNSNIHWNKPSSLDYSSEWQYPYPKPDTQVSVDDDIHLTFPYPNPSLVMNSPQLGGNDEPIFVEPVVVSSVDQLPTNYPVPTENISLGHNPITVVIGSQPPQIIVLEDGPLVLPNLPTVPAPASAPAAGAPVAADSEGSAAAAPAVAPAAAVPAAAGPLAASAAAAAVAGLGTLGVVGATGGIGAAATGSLGAAAAASAGTSAGAGTGAGAGSGVGSGANFEEETAAEVGGVVEGNIGLDTAVASTNIDATAYAPATVAESESDLETIYSDFYDFMMWLASLRFLRAVLITLYSIVLPHVSLLMTSVFSVLALFFPWLYPHIVVPFISLVSNILSR